ncbi:YfhO family protein, partial [uncultured Acidaminococcus sp.]|uniref:YfhO family protein n=1 Tax=uncultured Acidaminococcus sp. TaxID=352152 RepID=UPI0025E644C8
MEKENGIKEISFWKSVILAVLLAAGIIFFLFYLLQMAPLGKYAFSADDARIQYIDYFSFYKGILSGLNNPIYSFSKGLGGNVWGVMAYYLLSPLNGLIVFFTQKKLNSFYDILVLLKFSLASGTMAYYLQKRFHGTIESPFVILLGICYGLMQYNFEQAKNVMWLDPVTLFPLLLLGTYKVQRGNSILFLSIVIGLALIFNWYMGMIATMAAGFWSVWESLGIAIHQKSIEWKQWIFYECKIIAAILLGVCLAGAVLVPAFSTMAGGRAGIDWNVLNRRYIGSNSSFLLGLQSGAISTNQHVALFSGSFTVFCSLLWFINPKGLLRNKLWVLGLLLLLLPLFYWRPAYFLFSLLKNATSYWYRYSFVGIFPFLYLAGQALSCHAEKSIFHSFRKYLLLIYP